MVENFAATNAVLGPAKKAVKARIVVSMEPKVTSRPEAPTLIFAIRISAMADKEKPITE